MAAAAPFIIMGVGMAASAAAGVVSSVSANKTAQKNYELQKEQYEYEKNLQGQIMEREDNAIQRQVADSRAAGISPLYQMAGAQSAGAAGVAVNTPQKEQAPNTMATVLQGVGMLSSLVQSYASLKGTQTDNALKELDLQEKQSSQDDRLALIAEAAGMAKKQSKEYDAQVKRTAELHDIAKQMQELNLKNASREYQWRVDNNVYQSESPASRGAKSIFDMLTTPGDGSSPTEQASQEVEMDLFGALSTIIKKALPAIIKPLSTNNVKQRVEDKKPKAKKTSSAGVSTGAR